MRHLFPILLLIAGIIAAVPGRAQEVQVPIDTAGTVSVLSADLGSRMNLFPEYEHFREARLYRIGDDRYELVVRYEADGQSARDRRTLSASDVEHLRRRVSRKLTATKSATSAGIDQEGRYKLLTITTLMGAEQGLLLPVALGIENDNALGSLPFFGAAAGFGVPLLLTRNRSVTEARATMTLYGALQGNMHGLLLSVLVAGEDLSERTTAGTVALMSAGQAAAGYALAEPWGLSAGTAEMLGYGSFFGLGSGIGTAALIGDDETSDKMVAGMGLAGSLAGSYAGYALARTEPFTQGDARILSRSGTLGAQLAGALLIVTEVNEIRPAVGALMGGGLAGLGVGRALVHRRDFSRSQANIVWLGSWAGALLGGGLSIAADANGDAAAMLYTSGAIAGFGLTYSLYANDATVGGEEMSWRMNMTPGGGLAASRSLQGALTPRVSLRASF